MTKKTTAVAEVIDENTIATALTQQYDEAQIQLRRGVEAALKFGAMLIKAEEIVFAEGETKKHNGHESGYGLEAWLAKHCPTVNYKTAMRWKGIAENACHSISCNKDVSLRLLTGEKVDNSEVEDLQLLRNHVDYLYAAPSLRKLSQMCFNFAEEEAGKGGRPKAEQKPLPKLRKSEEAKAIWNGVMQMLSKAAVKDAIPLLDQTVTKICYDDLGDLRQLLKDHLEEF